MPIGNPLLFSQTQCLQVALAVETGLNLPTLRRWLKADIVLTPILGDRHMTECPVCGAEITFAEGTVIGELLECDDCGTELEVTGLDPAAVTEAPETEEDWGE